MLKGRPVHPTGDEWLSRVTGSREFDMLREIALWWRCFQISAQCRYTSRLLERLRCFEQLVAAYFESRATPPYIERLAYEFLDSLATHPDEFIRAVAASEAALETLRIPGSRAVEVVWDRNPDLVFGALENREPMPGIDFEYSYRLRIGHEIPGTVECVRTPRM